MQPDVRRRRILEMVRRDGGATVSDLAAACSVSAVTVHRDLERLAERGLIERVHGGALAPTGRSQIRTNWAERLEQAWAAKRAIAAKAVEFVEEGSTIFLDASTTCFALAQEIEGGRRNGLTLVTNSPAIAMELYADSVHIIVPPGEVDQNVRMIGGRWTTEFLGGLHFSTTFVSAAGLTLEEGLTTTRRDLADVINAARAVSTRTIALVDSTKFGRTSLLAIAEASQPDVLVVDDGLAPETVEAYRRAGVDLALAPMSGQSEGRTSVGTSPGGTST